MQQEKNIRWGTVAVTVAILILAASIFFAGFKIASMVNTNIQSLKAELKEELREDLRREAVSFIYAYRSSAMEDRQINIEDLQKGYEFAEKFLSR